jgi:AraC family transcriptional activator of pobA
MEFEKMIIATKRLAQERIPTDNNQLLLSIRWINARSFSSNSNYSYVYNERHKWHFHSIYEIHMNFFGCLVYEIRNGEDTTFINQGEMILLSPGCVHRCVSFSEEVKTFSIAFEIREVPDSDDSYNLTDILSNKPYRALRISEKIKSIVETICEEAISGEPFYQKMMYMSFVQLIHHIARCAMGNMNEKDRSKKQRVTIAKEDPRVRIVRDSIVKNMAFGVTCKSVADSINMSVRQTDRIIRAVTGNSLHDLIEQTKHKAACDMLLETDHTISEISEKLGFANQYSFSRFFRRVEGMSPSGFRMARHIY